MKTDILYLWVTLNCCACQQRFTKAEKINGSTDFVFWSCRSFEVSRAPSVSGQLVLYHILLIHAKLSHLLAAHYVPAVIYVHKGLANVWSVTWQLMFSIPCKLAMFWNTFLKQILKKKVALNPYEQLSNLMLALGGNMSICQVCFRAAISINN